MNSFTKASLTAAISLPLLAGCVTPGEDDANATTKQGAVGGALLGLTLGALTGDADLAMKGAIAGGVAGGVAGASHDIQNNRENIRHDSRNEAIAKSGSGSNNSADTTPQNWQELNHFVGEWNVTIRNHVEIASDVGSLEAKGQLSSISQAEIQVTNEQGIDLNAAFSYTAEQGYQLDITNKATDANVNFAGEHQPQVNRYNFYPTDIQDVIYTGISSADVRIELGMINDKVWILESYAFVDGSEQKIQSIRFNKVS